MRAPLPRPVVRLSMLGPPIAWCAVLWWASSQPGPQLDPSWNDKLVHGLVYGLLGALWTRALWFTTRDGPVRVYLSAVLLSVGYGVIDELHQSAVAGRDASLADGLANGAGATVGAALTLGLYLVTARLGRRRGVVPPERP